MIGIDVAINRSPIQQKDILILRGASIIKACMNIDTKTRIVDGKSG